jgi:lipopolysaccharide export system protein LptA
MFQKLPCPIPHVLVPFLLCLSILTVPAKGDTFTFRADKMSGGRASGKEVTVLMGSAEVRSDNMLLKASRIEIHGDNNQFIDCSGNVWGQEEEKNIL